MAGWIFKTKGFV